MCRWLAYSGPPVPLGTLVSRPDHSLIDQSVHARENEATTNGDGFGVGWYGAGKAPGRYRSTHPAWNDANLRDLSGHIVSGLFMAHVRAATGTSVQETNCHPFAFDNWLFLHNGEVPQFDLLRRQMALDIDPPLFPSIEGSTDSELLFFLALSMGLRDEPRAALERTVGYVERLVGEASTGHAFTFSAAASDGRRVFAVRYSSDGDSPSLYHSCHAHALRTVHGGYESLPEDAVVVLSEPLDRMSEHWISIPESTFLSVDKAGIEILPFEPKS